MKLKELKAMVHAIAKDETHSVDDAVTKMYEKFPGNKWVRQMLSIEFNVIQVEIEGVVYEVTHEYEAHAASTEYFEPGRVVDYPEEEHLQIFDVFHKGESLYGLMESEIDDKDSWLYEKVKEAIYVA